MLDQIENAIQVAVLLICVIAAAWQAVSRRSRAWTLLALFFGSWFLGDLYWLVCYLFYDTMPQISIVSDMSWYASFIFLYMLLRETVPLMKTKHLLPWLGPVFAAGMAVFFMQWGEYFNNVVCAVLMGLLLYASIRRLQDGQNRFLSALILIYCLLEYGLWISSCFWQRSVLSEPYYWFDFALTASFLLFIPATKWTEERRCK